MHPEFRLSASDEEARYRLHQNSPTDSGYCQHLRRAITPLTSLLPSGSGLDFGCGPHPTASELLRELGYEVTNYDPFFAPDTEALEREYDFVLCTEVAEHFYAPADEFERLHRILKVGGWLSLMTKLLTPEQSLATWWYAKDPTHVSFYSRSTLDWIQQKWSWILHSPSDDVFFFRKT
jgi:2-polyprenyl-3-methyl-5-hydroxy-6-metoxy-1,4-benzoquinol methylase